MEVQALTKGVRISPRKVRLVADAIRGMQVHQAVALLQTSPKHGASVLIKTLKSAIANALQKGNVQEADLFIVRLEVDGGGALRRMHIGSRSHVRMYTKRATHVRIVVGDRKNDVQKEEKAEKTEKPVRQAQTKKEEVK